MAQKYFLHLLLFSILFFGPDCSYAETLARITNNSQSIPLRPYVAVLEDPSGKLDIAAIERLDLAGRFQRVSGTDDLNFGYSGSTYWLRFRFVTEAGAADQWLLEVAYPSLDQVTLFTHSDDIWGQMNAGDLQAFSKRPFAHRNLVFPLDLPAAVEHTVYLRVRSEGSLTLPLTLWSSSALHAHDQTCYSLFALYFGMLLALGLYNLLLYVSLRDRAYLAYVACVAGMIVAQSSMLGLGNQFLWPNLPAWGNVALPVGFCITGFFGAMFTRQFLNTREVAPGFDKLIQILQLAFILAALTAIVYAYRPSGIATALIGTAFSASAVACGLLALKRGQPSAGLFLTAWLFLLLGVSMLGMRTLDWLPTNLLTSYGMLIGSAFEMLLLSLALAARIHVLRHEKELAQAVALRAERMAAAALKQWRIRW